MIQLADVAENSWGVVHEFKGLYEFADNEEENTKMANSDRSAGVKKRRMAASYCGSKRPRKFRQMWVGSYPQLMEPTPTLSPSPQPMNQYPQMRPRGIPGPCFYWLRWVT